MVEMAKPWKHPDTGFYYLRRQIPAELRPAFQGRQLHKVTLGTKDAKQAVALFLPANAELEARFDEARARLRATGSPLPSSRDRATTLIHAYVNGPPASPGGLDGPRRLELARREIDRGLWNGAGLPDGSTGLTRVAPSTGEEWAALAGNAALFAGHRGTVAHVGGVEPGGVWQRRDLTFAGGGRAAQLDRLAEQIALHHGLARGDLPSEIGDELEAFLDALPVGKIRSRRPRDTTGRLRPDMRMTELFEKWAAKQKPSAQTAAEYRASVDDFVDFLGDIPAGQVAPDDLLDYRDEAANLPAAMPRADRLLAFTMRVAKHLPKQEPKEGEPPPPPRISPGTLKKRVGAIQAMLTFAKEQRWIGTNVGRGLSVVSGSNPSRKRRGFEEEQLAKLFAQPLFLDPAGWSWRHRTSDCTLYWLFLICCTTGARLEEVGQALLVDVKQRGRITWIDVDDYIDEEAVAVAAATAPGDGGGKSIKTDSSRRLVPIHVRLVELGFVDYCDALRATGQIRVFPDLLPNGFDKRTQDASKRANALINRAVSKDPRLVFYSFRHSFKDRATEAGLSTRVVDQICGHAPTSQGDKYGEGVRIAALHRFLHRVRWPGLDWEPLVRAAAGTDWQAVAAHHASRSTA